MAVHRANLLTEIWKLEDSQLHLDEHFFYSQVCLTVSVVMVFDMRSSLK